MKKIILFVGIILGGGQMFAQDPVTVSDLGNCFSPAVTIPFSGTFMTKPFYDIPTGNFAGNPAQLTIRWLGLPTGWGLFVSGGTLIFSNSSDTPLPPGGTGWTQVLPFDPNCPLGSTMDVTGGVTLPVELISFHGEIIRTTVHLSWETASETNNEGFEIEHSIDAKTFSKIGFVKGTGTTLERQVYAFQDVQPENGINYYRLKQIDFDGKFEHSKIISFTIEGATDSNEVSVFPNPVAEKITLKGTSLKGNRVSLRDHLGRVVWVSIAADATHTFDLSNFSSGMYFLEIQNDRETTIKQIMKF